MNEALGLLETHGLTPTLAAVDAMEKAADVRVVQCELNDLYGVSTKIRGAVSAVEAAIAAAAQVAESMGGRPVSTVIPRPEQEALRAVIAPRERNPLIEQDVVFFAHYEQPAAHSTPATKESPMTQDAANMAIGLIETQGFTAVFEAVDTACKTANVEVLAKEKLGGGYVTIVLCGQLSAVTAAVEAGKAKVEGLGKLIAAHVIARPSAAVLALLPKG